MSYAPSACVGRSSTTVAADSPPRPRAERKVKAGTEVRTENSTRNLIVDMTRELGEMREEVASCRPLSDEVLTRLLSLVRLHCDGLSAAVQQCIQVQVIVLCCEALPHRCGGFKLTHWGCVIASLATFSHRMLGALWTEGRYSKIAYKYGSGHASKQRSTNGPF